MIVRVVRVHVHPEHAVDFETATHANHIGSVQEAGVLRFDVLRQDTAATAGAAAAGAAAAEYLLIEVYRDAAAVEAHKQTIHYARWRDAVAPMMTAPRDGANYLPIAPMAESDWAMAGTSGKER